MKRLTLLCALVTLAAFGGSEARAATACHLAYQNGALIPSVKIVALYWGTTNNGQYKYKDQLRQYYDGVTNSPYFDWLIEYNVGGYSISRGGFAAEYADAAAPAKAIIDETNDLQPWISKLIDDGKIPAPDANTLYFVHLPGSSQVSSGAGGTTCSDNCAYHFFYTKGTQEVRYAVIPDQNSGACSTNPSCPTQLAAFDRLTIVASHELVEAVTDPDGGGWIDNNQACGEIGDICVGQPGKAAGFTVQLEWSNKNAKCIDHDASVVFNDFALALTPAGATASAGGSAAVSVAAQPTTGSQPLTVALTAEGLPVGVTGSFASPSLQSNASTMLTLAVAASVAPGSYPYSVTGTAQNGAHHTAAGMLTVQPEAPDLGTTGGGGNGEGGGSGGSTGGGGNGGSTGVGGSGNGNGDTGGGAKGGCSIIGVGAGGGHDGSGGGATTMLALAMALAALLGRRQKAAHAIARRDRARDFGA